MNQIDNVSNRRHRQFQTALTSCCQRFQDRLCNVDFTDPPQIEELPRSVVLCIAAGEVIDNPVCAIKELLDNALDAHSLHINVQLSARGFRIRDDGYGIRFDDLPILCRRHTTSKLRSFKDLQDIKTLGFRGEALCSISHVGRLTVTTRPVTSSYGMRIQYLAEEMLAAPIPCAAHTGTTIAVDLNSNQASKLVDEAAIEIFRSYALHCLGVGFALEREAATKLRVETEDILLDRLSKLYGTDVARNAVALNSSGFSELPGCDLSGYGSWTEVGKSRLVLFINDRCVECRPMKRAIEAVYTDCLPKKAPFVYVSLQLPSDNVDVNIHPAKREVAFLNKERIIRIVAVAIRDAIRCSPSAGRNKGNYMLCRGHMSLPQIIHSQEPTSPSMEIMEEECKDRSMNEHPLMNDIALDVELRGIVDQIEQNEHKECVLILREHKVIGISGGIHTFVQFREGLYLLNMEILSHEFVTQLLWKGIGNLEKWKMKMPLLLPVDQDRVTEQTSDEDKELATVMEDKDRHLLDEAEKRVALDRLLSIEISKTGHLLSLPLPLPSRPPKAIRLMSFSKQLGKLIRSWNGSISHLSSMIDTLALLFSIQQKDAVEGDDDVREMLDLMQQVYAPSIDRAQDGSIIKLATVSVLCSRFGR